MAEKTVSSRPRAVELTTVSLDGYIPITAFEGNPVGIELYACNLGHLLGRGRDFNQYEAVEVLLFNHNLGDNCPSERLMVKPAVAPES